MVMMSSGIAALIDVESEPDNKREWGEERYSDVIYNVVLKRVLRATLPSQTRVDGKQWETLKVRHIKAASIGYLVSQLCQSFLDEWEEKNFLTVFFATYRSYARAEEVLEKIADECEKLKKQPDERKEQVLRSIRRVMRTWLERHFAEDFYSPPDFKLLHKIIAVAEGVRDESGGDGDCEFLGYVRSKLSAAEVMNTQEEAIENLNTPTHFSDIHNETEDFTLDTEPALNSDAAKMLLTVFDPLLVAEQLTVKDANLFLRVVPHHCLKAVRSSKDKPPCVRATIEQFNRIVYCVLGTCLCASLKTSQRAKILCKWIEIAQQCRELKNFSSLHAIVSGLQTHAIHRLKKTWQHVPHTHTELLNEISQINMKDMLLKVGTAKVNTESSSISKVRKDATFRRQRAIDSGIMHGTVPYLGSFLTDLTYLHTAKPDYLENRLINFDKCRKEFEQLAQLQLWQASCKGYQHIESDRRFNDWFNSITLPSNELANKLSEEIESPSVLPASPSNNFFTPVKRSQSDRIFSIHSGPFDSSGSGSSSATPNHARKYSDDAKDTNGGGSSAASKSNGHAVAVDSQSDEERVIKVIVVRNVSPCVDETQLADVKEMKLSSNDRTGTVVRNALALFNIGKESANAYSLVQLLPDARELCIPDSSNVFYAMNSSMKEYHFALLEDGSQIKPVMRPASLQLSAPPLKSNKKHRKTASMSSTSQNLTSPMRGFSRYLAMGGLSIASGSYSPAKESLRREDIPPNFPTERRDALITVDDSALILAKYSSSGRVDREDFASSWNQKMWKMMRKGQRQNDSEAAFDNSDDEESNNIRPRTHRMRRDRFRHSAVLPEQANFDFAPSSESASTYSRSSTASEDNDVVDGMRCDAPEDEAFPAALKSMTFPRNRNAPTPSVDRTWTRRGAVRKHQSSHQFTAGIYRQISDQELAARLDSDTMVPESGPQERFKRQNSRSKFYVDMQQEGDCLESSGSSHSMEPIKESSFEAPLLSKTCARSSSDPCILDLGAPSHDDVFGDPGTPHITVQCPSPQKSAFKAIPNAGVGGETTRGGAVGHSDSSACSNAAEDPGQDESSPVDGRSRSSTGESEFDTYL